MVRTVIFWGHLAAGLLAGTFVLVMAATGALLTYEGQIESWAQARAVAVPDGAETLSVETLVATSGAQPGQVLTLPRDADGPVTLSQGRQSLVLDPLSGAVVADAGAGVAGFFHAVESLHRWLSLSGSTVVGSALVDAANLAFLGLVVSGLYLWLPKAWKWSMLKSRLLFRRGLPTAQARDYNWHHVLGVWALVPLFVIALTGVVMSYSWANTLLFAAVGESAPVRGGPPGASPVNAQNGTGGGQQLNAGSASQRPTSQERVGDPMDYASLIALAQPTRPDWVRAQIALPETGAATVAITLDAGNGQQPGAKTRLVMDRTSGAIVSADTGATGSTGQRLRMWARFAHTGQYYGVIGQTVAGLASLAAMVLVYTGAALGIRRLVRMGRGRRALRA